MERGYELAKDSGFSTSGDFLTLRKTGLVERRGGGKDATGAPSSVQTAGLLYFRASKQF